jgi:hypothetical protein
MLHSCASATYCCLLDAAQVFKLTVFHFIGDHTVNYYAVIAAFHLSDTADMQSHSDIRQV